jgi:hypothetical protein
MIGDTDIQLAARNHALALVVATTGMMSLSATAMGYARATGSFYADGFWPGMEVVPVGFPQTAPGTITDVTPTTLTIRGGRSVAAAAGARSLTVGLPTRRAWENIAFTPTTGEPYVEEQYAPGAAAQVTLGPLGEIEARPTYFLLVNLPSDTGLTLGRYTDALARHFAPRTAIALTSGEVLTVRSDVAPRAGQLQQSATGFAVKPFRIPLRIRSSNLI